MYIVRFLYVKSGRALIGLLQLTGVEGQRQFAAMVNEAHEAHVRHLRQEQQLQEETHQARDRINEARRMVDREQQQDVQQQYHHGEQHDANGQQHAEEQELQNQDVNQQDSGPPQNVDQINTNAQITFVNSNTSPDSAPQDVAQQPGQIAQQPSLTSDRVVLNLLKAITVIRELRGVAAAESMNNPRSVLNDPNVLRAVEALVKTQREENTNKTVQEGGEQDTAAQRNLRKLHAELDQERESTGKIFPSCGGILGKYSYLKKNASKLGEKKTNQDAQSSNRANVNAANDVNAYANGKKLNESGKNKSLLVRIPIGPPGVDEVNDNRLSTSLDQISAGKLGPRQNLNPANLSMSNGNPGKKNPFSSGQRYAGINLRNIPLQKLKSPAEVRKTLPGWVNMVFLEHPAAASPSKNNAGGRKGVRKLNPAGHHNFHSGRGDEGTHLRISKIQVEEVLRIPFRQGEERGGGGDGQDDDGSDGALDDAQDGNDDPNDAKRNEGNPKSASPTVNWQSAIYDFEGTKQRYYQNSNFNAGQGNQKVNHGNQDVQRCSGNQIQIQEDPIPRDQFQQDRIEQIQCQNEVVENDGEDEVQDEDQSEVRNVNGVIQNEDQNEDPCEKQADNLTDIRRQFVLEGSSSEQKDIVSVSRNTVTDQDNFNEGGDPTDGAPSVILGASVEKSAAKSVVCESMLNEEEVQGIHNVNDKDANGAVPNENANEEEIKCEDENKSEDIDAVINTVTKQGKKMPRRKKISKKSALTTRKKPG
jgi:hypothetical protein